MGWSIKKPLGSKNSVVRRVISKPIPTLLTGGLGMAYTDMKANAASKQSEFEREQQSLADQEAAAQGDLEAMARLEESKRKALGLQQQGQINTFADQQEGRAKEYRGTLASSLASHGQQFFNQLNPGILEDLNSRGLFTSQTARDKSQGDALKEIELANQQQLMNFDTQSFNDINDIRGSGLSAMLGGDQGALDSALELRKAGIQRKFDEQDSRREQSYGEMLARRQSRDQLLQSIIGGGIGALGALCFDPSTEVEMISGKKVKMADVQLGDVLSDGGVVISVRDALTAAGTFFDYKGVKVTGYHAVKENDEWTRVKESHLAKPLLDGGIIRTVGTTTHRLFINGVEFADELETDMFNQIGLEDSLKVLNSQLVSA